MNLSSINTEELFRCKYCPTDVTRKADTFCFQGIAPDQVGIDLLDKEIGRKDAIRKGKGRKTI